VKERVKAKVKVKERVKEKASPRENSNRDLSPSEQALNLPVARTKRSLPAFSEMLSATRRTVAH